MRVSADLPDHPVQSIALDMLYPTHFTHLRWNEQALRHVGTTYDPFCSLEYFAVKLEAPLIEIPDIFRRLGALAEDMVRSNDRA
ncbi:hypothetical protein TNCV_2761671 [Trichonephila clavipes]|nr:hypothetical protein TNCV_2761671 [Trichonephila clavipes]